jgi:hypothetical protein
MSQAVSEFGVKINSVKKRLKEVVCVLEIPKKEYLPKLIFLIII